MNAGRRAVGYREEVIVAENIFDDGFVG